MTDQPNTIEERVLALSSNAVGLMPFDKIYIAPDRQREDTPEVRRYINEDLAPSINEKGVIQPVILHFSTEGPITRDGVEYECELIAGWCRSQACLALGMTQIPYNTRFNLTQDQLFELELAENFDRKDFTWQETVVAIYKIHRQKQLMMGAKDITWGQRESGKLLGVSHGYVGECERLAKAILAGDEAVKSAPTYTKAKEVLLARKSDEAMAKLAALTGAAPVAKSNPLVTGPVRPTAGISLADAIAKAQSNAPTTDLVADLTGSPSGAVQQQMVENLHINLGDILFNMDNRDFFAQCQPETFDLIYTDIPYGIDMDNLDFNAKDLDRVEEAHDVEENVDQMLPFLENSYKVLKDKSYLLFWYDIKHQEKLVAWGEQVGFTVCPYPYLWLKLHPCRNRAGNIWPTKAVEYCMIMRKGTAQMRKPMTKNFFEADGSAERKLQRNPFAKPFAISQHLLSHFSIPGDHVLDCYAGEGSLVRAGLNLGCRMTAVEKEKTHFDRLMEHVKSTYNTLTRNKAVFTFEQHGH